MILNLYSIKDVLNGYAAPVIMPNHATAIRWFQDMCEENLSMKNHMDDFSVHFIGQLNSETGEIRGVEEKYLKKDLANFKGDEV